MRFVLASILCLVAGVAEACPVAVQSAAVVAAPAVVSSCQAVAVQSQAVMPYAVQSFAVQSYAVQPLLVSTPFVVASPFVVESARFHAFGNRGHRQVNRSRSVSRGR